MKVVSIRKQKKERKHKKNPREYNVYCRRKRRR